MKTPKIFNKVHCHICPMKECCDYSVPDASWRLQMFLRSNGFANQPHKKDWSDVEKATLSCPLKKLIKNEE